MKPFTIEIYSDIVCPWCYVGKRYIDQALEYYAKAFEGERQPEVSWLPYQLHSMLPREGVDRHEYLKRRYPGEADRAKIFDKVTRAGQKMGLGFHFERIEVQPNTLDAHRLMLLAERKGARVPVTESLFRAYFIEGRNLSSHDVLVDIARSAGMDGDEVAAYLAGEEDVEWVQSTDANAKRLGISTVPFIVLNGRRGVSGNSPPDQIFDAFRWARRDAVRPKWLPSFF